MSNSTLILQDVKDSLGLSGGGGSSALQGATNSTSQIITGTLSILPNSTATAVQTYTITPIAQSSSSSFAVFCTFRLNFNVTSSLVVNDDLAYNISLSFSGGGTTFLEPSNNNYTLKSGVNKITYQTTAIFNGDYSTVAPITATINISYTTTGTNPLAFTILDDSYQSGYVLSLKNTN
jgi:hypothetical protein